MRTLFAALACLLGIGSAGAQLPPPQQQRPDALVNPTLRAVRCPRCGWIESKREIARPGSDAQALPSYEYTVRLGDGSSRVFREALPVSWRLGERLIYIEGRAPLN